MAARRKTSESGSIEEALQRLESIADTLQQGELSLEESLKLYEEALTLSRSCAERLQHAALTVQRLEKDLEGTLRLINEDPDADNE